MQQDELNVSKFLLHSIGAPAFKLRSSQYPFVTIDFVAQFSLEIILVS